MSQGTGNDGSSSELNSELNSQFFTVSEDSASVGNHHGAHAYSSDNQSAHSSTTFLSSNTENSNWGEDRAIQHPLHPVPPLRYQGSDSSLQSYGSTSSGTVDYIYRSDVLSVGSSKSGNESQSSYDSWEQNSRINRKK